jgi:guanylate kinase
MSSSPARLFVIAAPSGAGKTTLVKLLLERNPGLEFSISYTTREQRKTEVDGRDYFFVDEKRFIELQQDGELLESALVFGNYYGTGRSQVEQRLRNGKHVILEIDWQGARQVRESMPDCVSIFILPPGRAELERRLRDRRTDSDEVITRRLQEAEGDMTHWDEFDFVIVNEDLNTAVSELEAVVNGKGDANRSSNPELRKTLQSIVGAD